MIPFAEWRPDLADLNNPTVDAKNVLPSQDGYRSLPSMEVQSNALTYYCRGAIAAKAKDTTSYNYAGDEKNLYIMTNNAWAEANGNGGGADAYALGAKENWEFAKWGENVIAVGGANSGDPVPQIGALNGADFTDLGGDPPRARHIAIVRNFVVLGNLYEDAEAHPNRVRWSGINNEIQWATDRTTQADYQPLEGNGGWIQAIRGGEYGVIFQERSIWRMIYKGPPEVFSFNEIPDIGTPAANSVIQKGDACYFYAEDGFYVTVGGQNPTPIGRHILDRYVKNDFDLEEAHRMVGGEDKNRQVLWWIYPGVGHASGRPNKAVIFDYNIGRWSYAEIEAEWVYDSLGSSTALDDFPAAGYSNLDTVPITLDSDIWKGGAVTFGIFDEAHKQNQLTGTAMSGCITTQEVMLQPPGRAAVTRVRPIIEGGEVTVTPGTRNDIDEGVTWGSALSEKANGTVPMRTNAQYHRFKVENTGDFDRALGVLPVDVSDAGSR